jgi:putative hydrolase of HD superfamily
VTVSPDRLAVSAELAATVRFLVELDRAKSVERRTYLVDGSRREDDASHMWHAAVAALVLARDAPGGLDLGRAVAMLLVHDIPEIDAGDTLVYDSAARARAAALEEAGARRIFGLLPPDAAQQLAALWEEFEHGHTAEARFARAVDRLLPLLANWAGGGRAWREHGVTADRVREVNALVGDAVPRLRLLVEALVDDAVARGLLPESHGAPATPAPTPAPPRSVTAPPAPP